jgi:hypothetical protein
MKTHCVFREVGIELISIININFLLRRVIQRKKCRLCMTIVLILRECGVHDDKFNYWIRFYPSRSTVVVGFVQREGRSRMNTRLLHAVMQGRLQYYVRYCPLYDVVFYKRGHAVA